MSLSPVAFIAPNYRDFKGRWIKFYEPGTTTAKIIYLDSSGASLAAKVQINTEGFIVSAGAAIVVPYVDGSYDAYIFATEADADANDTSGAERIADGITGSASDIQAFDNIAVMTSTNLTVGQLVRCKRYYSGGDLVEGLVYEIQATQVVDGYVDHALANGNVAILSEQSEIKTSQAGASSTISDNAPHINACTSSRRITLITGGDLPTSQINVGNERVLESDKNSRLVAITDNQIVINATNAFESVLSRLSVFAGGFAGVTGIHCDNFRHACKIDSCYVDGCEIGYNLDILCWNTTMIGNYAINSGTAYRIHEGSNAVTLIHCSSNLSSVAGIHILDGTSFATETVNLVGGFHQAAPIGLHDEASATKVNGTYFETCSVADVFADGARFGDYKTYHSANTGPVAHQGRNSEAITIHYPVLLGTRVGGLYDYDATNTFCKSFKNQTGGINTALGITTGIAVETLNIRHNTSGEVGIGGEPFAGYKFGINLAGGGDLRATDFGSSSAFGTYGGSKVMRWNAPSGHRFFTGTAGAETESWRFEDTILSAQAVNSGVVLRSPDNTPYTIRVSNAGAIVVS